MTHHLATPRRMQLQILPSNYGFEQQNKVLSFFLSLSLSVFGTF